MKIIELKRNPKTKIGRFEKNGLKLEPHEEKTIYLLRRYGLNIELIIPTNIPKSNNPDIFMLGTMWEIKAPRHYNEQTIKNRMKKASKQAGHVIFDLRNLHNKYNEMEKYIIKLFIGNSDIRRIMIIRKDEKILDFLK